MSATPPPLPQSEPELPPRRGRSTLAKLCIAFATTIVVTFGLCSVALMNSTSGISGPIFPAAIIVEGICVVGLVVVAILAIVQRRRQN